MPRHHPSATLDRVLDIRLIQRQAVEARVAEAARRLGAAEHARDAASERLETAEARWREALSARSLPLHLTGALSQVILTEAASLDQTRQEVDAAEDHKSRTEQDWRTALADEDAAKTLARAARRAEIRRREEAVLSAAADQISLRGAAR